MLGDININILDEEESANYLSVVYSGGLKCFLKKSTRGKSHLDHIMERLQNISIRANKCESLITDHAAIHVELETHTSRIKYSHTKTQQ